MSGRPADAETCLAQARDALEGDPPSDELLSLLNISALNRLKLGDWEGALAMEHRIRSALAGRSGSVWQFRYVNSLNLSRLHRRRRELDAAERYREEAFATVAGSRSESDAIHANVLAARIAEDRGDPSAAMVHWARAALHWAAADAPEAVAPRVTAAILRDRERADGNVCDATSDALVEHLCAATGDGAVVDGTGERRAPAFVRSERAGGPLADGRAWIAAEAAGAMLLCSEEPALPALRSPASERLRLALFELLARSIAAERRTAVGTVVVDARLGREIPSSRAELIEACLRLGVRELVERDEVMRLHDDERARLEAELRVTLGPAVDAVDRTGDGLVVRFKRYLAPLVLSGSRAAVVEPLAAGAGAAELPAGPLAASAGTGIHALRSLEEERVISLRLPPESLPGVATARRVHAATRTRRST